MSLDYHEDINHQNSNKIGLNAITATRSRRPKRATSSNDNSNGNESSDSPDVEVHTNVQNLADAELTSEGELKLIDGTVFHLNDCIYLICEPPSEPYYIGRIMEFVKRGERTEQWQMRINWFYRPRDIPTRSTDTRQLYATMHSDLCPVASIRGKCIVKHRAHIGVDLATYRANPDCFWFDKLYDRYICRFYEMLPTEKIQNMPADFAAALRARARFGVVEMGRSKELCQPARNCVRCGQFCSPDESVCCAVCGQNYHMGCVRPALVRKPTRGFAWSCAVCSKEEERKRRERKGKFLGDNPEEDQNVSLKEIPDSEGEDADQSLKETGSSTGDDDSLAGTSISTDNTKSAMKEFKVADDKLSAEQRRELSMWPYIYVGQHCQLENVLNNNDRIFPRAVSRLGARHQAEVSEWEGIPAVFELRPMKSKSKLKNKYKGKKWKAAGGGESEEEEESVERGGDTTVTLRWRTPNSEILSNDQIDAFIAQAQPFAERLGMRGWSANFLDDSLAALMAHGYNAEAALVDVGKFTRSSLKEPTLSPEEVSRFEEGVGRWGSELGPVSRFVKTANSADVVRFYYLWKKTPSGHRIWDHFEGRRRKKDIKASSTVGNTNGLVDGVADSQDDSAFDAEKLVKHSQKFKCKFCGTNRSRIWRRAPGQGPVNSSPASALCWACGQRWRKYAEIRPAVATNATKKRVKSDEPLKMIPSTTNNLEESGTKETASKLEVLKSRSNVPTKTGENESKPSAEVSDGTNSTTKSSDCAICGESESTLRCSRCGLRVHAICYGISMPSRKNRRWTCEPCDNARRPRAALLPTSNRCVLCPVRGGALRITTGRNWAHVLCAAWTPEVQVQPGTRRPISDIGKVPLSRWRAECSICGLCGIGACVSCCRCGRAAHVGCARETGFGFGFEVLTGNSTIPVLWCPGHGPNDSVNSVEVRRKPSVSSSLASAEKPTRAHVITRVNLDASSLANYIGEVEELTSLNDGGMRDAAELSEAIAIRSDEAPRIGKGRMKA
ncbi:uncharacterized protein V1516DRAFT_621863 [Lipomyces oligophaga]|uniref:uncharacterized protein n=1 Tax=Lipomyces oligophaga TaxID=45792 RepID=UPI0034CE564D